MADLKIEDLTDGSNLQAGDRLEVSRGSVSRKALADSIISQLAGLPNSAIENVALAGTTSTPARGRINFTNTGSAAVAVSDNSGSNSKDVLVSGKFLYFSSPQAYSPADATTYFFGGLNFAPTSSATIAAWIVPYGVTLIRAELDVLVTGTLGSGESASAYVRINDTTDVTISTAVLHSAAQNIYNATLNTAIAANDFLEFKIVLPTWATNPTNVFYMGYLWFQ